MKTYLHAVAHPCIRWLLLGLVLFQVVGLANRIAAAERPNIVWLISEDNSLHYMQLFDPHGTPTPRIA